MLLWQSGSLVDKTETWFNSILPIVWFLPASQQVSNTFYAVLFLTHSFYFFQILGNIFSSSTTIMKPSQNLMIVSHLSEFSDVPIIGVIGPFRFWDFSSGNQNSKKQKWLCSQCLDLNQSSKKQKWLCSQCLDLNQNSKKQKWLCSQCLDLNPTCVSSTPWPPRMGRERRRMAQHPAGTSKDSDICDLSKVSDIVTLSWRSMRIILFYH